MNTACQTPDKRHGSVMFVVMMMTLLGSLAVGSILSRTLQKTRAAEIQVCLERAFYIAQGGAERAATWIAQGNEHSATLTGEIGNGSYSAVITTTPDQDGQTAIDIRSVGTVTSAAAGYPSVSRTITLKGVKRVSWSRYALWYDREAMTLWIVPGEKFGGRVYSRPQLRFHHNGLPYEDQVVFSEHVASGASAIRKSSTAVEPVFEQGISLDAKRETMASVSFAELESQASSGGLVLKGPTEIEIVGGQMKITNAHYGWNDKTMDLPANGVIYVKDTTTQRWAGYRRGWVTETLRGTVDIKSPAGLNGRLTIASEDNINIVDHLRYNSNPRVDANSDDALGMIALDNIVVETTAPNNLDIYAHMIAVNGGFGVRNYDRGYSRGYLNVYGGIVNKIRQAVGIVGGSGYNKNYMYDIRFRSTPPPCYPKLSDELEWTEWDG